MRGTLRVLAAESLRLFATRGTWVAALFLVLVPVARVWASHLALQAQRVQALSRGVELAGLESGLGWAPWVEGWRAGLALGALLLLIFGARSLAGDRESGLLRLAATRTATRPALVLGRALLGPPLVLAVVALTGLSSWAAAAIWFDFGPLVEAGFPILEVDEVLAEVRVAVLAALPALLAVHALGLLVSSLARGATSAVAMSVALFLAYDLLKESLGALQPWVFATYSPSFVDTSAMSELAGIARGYSDSGYTEAMLRMNFVVPWPELLLALALACLATARKRI